MTEDYDIWGLKRRHPVKIPVTIIVYGRETRQIYYEHPPADVADAWIWYGPSQPYVPHYWGKP